MYINIMMHVLQRKKREDEALLESRERKIAAGWHVLVSDEDSFAMSKSKAKQVTSVRSCIQAVTLHLAPC